MFTDWNLVNISQKAQNPVPRLVCFELVFVASVFSSIYSYDFVALEKHYWSMLKIPEQMTRSLEIDTQFQKMIHILQVYQGNMFYVKSYWSIFFSDAFLRFCSASKALSHHMNISRTGHPIGGWKQWLSWAIRVI